MTTTTDTRAEAQARSQLEGIKNLVADLENDDAVDDGQPASERIQGDPLSIAVRSGWQPPGSSFEAEEYQILLCTGGPAVRIIGELGPYDVPENAEIEYQDWFTSWTPLGIYGDDEDAVLTYARQFYFGS